MKIFLDTSSLFKLYHQELGSDLIESIFTNYQVTAVFLSEVAKVEFASTVWKKVRKDDITETQAKAIIEAFEMDFGKYIFVQIDSIIIQQSQNLVTKYGKQGLRTLDSIQLSTAVFLKTKVDLFKTDDQLLDSFLKQEELPTKEPSR